jgi:hypothetical protein
MTVALLERAAASLGPVLDEIVFVGGATVVLWITDPGAPPPRPTKDVDVVVEVFTRAGLHDFEARLRQLGFREDQQSGVICRWRHGPGDAEDLLLDVMPADAALMGFSNRWQAAGLPEAVARELPSGARIRALSPPYLVATKLEAFRGRGAGDLLGSRDLEDVVLLVDGREELTGEVEAAHAELRRFLAAEVENLLTRSAFSDAVFGFLRPDMASQRRAESVILPRFRELAQSA